jgi:hypothetical protein
MRNDRLLFGGGASLNLQNTSRRLMFSEGSSVPLGAGQTRRLLAYLAGTQVTAG